MFFPMAVIAFDFGHVPVFSFLLGNDIDTRGRGVGVMNLSPRLLWRQGRRWWFWSFFGLAEEVCWVEEDCFPLNVSAEGESVDLFFLLESFSSFLVGLFPLGHFKSMLRVLAQDYSITFVSALTAFFTTSFQEFKSGLGVSIWARIEGFRSCKKHQIMIRSFGVVPGSNSWRTACRYSRWAAQLRTSSC